MSDNMASRPLTRTIALLKQYSACDVSDALVKAGIRNGGFFPNLRQISRSDEKGVQSAAGPAYTVLYAPLDDPRPVWKGGYIDSVPAGAILVLSLPNRQQLPTAPYTTVSNALYGGLMSTRAKYLQAGGTVVFGRIRDVAEHRALNYPVHAYGTGTTAPGTAVKIVGVDVPIEIRTGEAEYQVINPGEIVVADENGVVRIPNSLDLAKLVEYIPKRVAADELVAQDIVEGVPALQAQKTRRAGL